MNRDIISVIVPIYRIERYLGLCIESLINQTYKNLEIILVDDGSPDRCPEICDLYAKKDSRIKVIHKENGGLVSARKAGISIATGKYVGYVDGDDWVGEGFYESLHNHITAHYADIACAGFQRDLFSKTAVFTDNLQPGLYEGESLEVLKRRMLSDGDFFKVGVSTYVWNKLFKRELLLETQLNVDNAISIGEDGAVTYPALMKANKVVLTAITAYHYRQREDSMLKLTTSFDKDAEKLQALHKYLSAYAKDTDAKYKLQEQIDDYVLGICIMRSGDVDYFSKQIEGRKVVVYSAGTFGQQLMNRLREANVCDVVGWVDDDYWEYRRCCMDVDPVSRIARDDFDYILIATVNPSVSDYIKLRISDYGVDADKVLTISKEQNSKTLIQKYFSYDF
ncbi:hypothetical protein CIK96_12095 [Prevotella sp. P4-98]|uniref:glycosyltransferase family 2 protein n=1 Tax=Prevotella sp. P4-98 TaxID=2024219 RepID=UPI000B974138|nr:glycosyltransferase family 2 protein [Prevotella sp. P4-98]OYP44148.1 hypothetical protein CIK96_12095 [Prevotella sp. P4-98]